MDRVWEMVRGGLQPPHADAPVVLSDGPHRQSNLPVQEVNPICCLCWLLIMVNPFRRESMQQI